VGIDRAEHGTTLLAQQQHLAQVLVRRAERLAIESPGPFATFARADGEQ